MSKIPRVTTLSIGGIATTPGKGAYAPGSCSVLRNFRFVGKNRLRGILSFSTPTQGGSSGGFPTAIIPLKQNKTLVIQIGATDQIYGNNVTANQYLYPQGYSSASLVNVASTTPVVVRDRLIVNTSRGCLVSDYSDPDFTVPSNKQLRAPGIARPTIQGVTNVSGGVQTIPADTMVSYTVVVRRQYSDGYQLESPPSVTQLYLPSIGVSSTPTLTVRTGYTDDWQAGDIVQLYRSSGLPTASYSAAFDSGNDCYLVASKVITAGEATAKQVQITDSQKMTSPDYQTFGELVYTAPTAFEGPSQPSTAPPSVVQSIAYWQGQTFYASYSDPPILSLQVKGAWGLLTTAFERLNGVGVRQNATACTITSGSAVITGVSASDLVGVVPNQLWSGSEFPAGTKVSSVGATTITMSQVATSNGTIFTLSDAVELDGTLYRAGFASDLIQQLGGQPYDAVASENVWLDHSQAGQAQQGVEVSIRPSRYKASMTYRVTNAANYVGSMQDIGSAAATLSATTHQNLIRYSKPNKPEACPAENSLAVGSGSIVAMTSTTDYLYCWTTKGLWVVSGQTALRVDAIDHSCLLSTPKAQSEMADTVFAVTDRGLVRVRGAAIQTISRGAFEEKIPGATYQASLSCQLQCDASREECWVLYPAASASGQSTMYLWSERYQGLTEVQLTGADSRVRCLSINSGNSSLVPSIVMGLYDTVITTPRLATWDESAGAYYLPVMAYLRELGELGELGDTFTVKQWIDVSWLFGFSDTGHSVNGFINNPGSLYSTSTLTQTPLESRTTHGIPRSASLRPNIEIGVRIQSPTRLVELLGVSVRVVPRTTQESTR